MLSCRTAFRRALVSGAAASLASAAVLVWVGRSGKAGPWRPLNAISHWVWGDAAFAQGAPSARHTVLGYAIHHTVATGWAFSYEQLAARRAAEPTASDVALAAATIATTSCFVDFAVTPHRFTPGFQHHLSKRAIAGTYAAFGVGLALHALWRAWARNRS